MKSTFKIGRIKVQSEEVNHISSRIVEDKMEVTTDKSPLYVELNDIEVCYEDFTAGDVVTIAKEVGSQVFAAVKEGVAMQRQEQERQRQIRKEEEAQRQEMNRRARQSRQDKHTHRMGKLTQELSKFI
jgi:glucosamine 6-phosphate synthetase-like amidotransferase/phosphosugar isomerase protein